MVSVRVRKWLKPFLMISSISVLATVLMSFSQIINIVPHKYQRSCDYGAWRYWKHVLLNTLGTDTKVKVFEPLEEDDSISLNQCVMLNCLSKKAPICIYAGDFISTQILKTGFWEKEIVTEVWKVLRSDPSLVMLDLGCNIGVFTITAAANGHTVVGVDAHQKNLRLLSKSLCLGKIYTNVTLVWNAVSNNRTLLHLHERKGNVGGTYIEDMKEPDKDIPDDNKAYSILLDDLFSFFDDRPIFMKIDIEGSEYKAFMSGKRFLKDKNVKFILMEWIFHKGKDSGQGIIDLLQKASFKPYSGNKFNVPLKVNQSDKWPIDVFWKREL